MKKIIAILLCFVLAFANLSVVAFAFGMGPNEEYADKNVVSITAVAQRNLIEKIDGTAEDYDEITGEYVHFFAYDVYASNPIITICFDDGTEIKGTIEEIEAETGVFMYVEPIICYEEEHVGAYTTAVTYMDKTAEFQVEIVSYTLGDVNDDGQISAMDARAILQYVAMLRDFNETQLLVADANRDGKISSIDARWVLQAVAGTRIL